MLVEEANLYIEVSTMRVQKCRRRYIYVLEYPQRRETETATGLGENVSLERAVLTAVERGAGRIKEPVELRIYMGCRYILAPLENGDYEKWEEKGFQRSKGGEVKNKDLWIKVKRLLDGHSWSGEGNASHPYQKRMVYDLGKRKEKDERKAEGSAAGTKEAAKKEQKTG